MRVEYPIPRAHHVPACGFSGDSQDDGDLVERFPVEINELNDGAILY
jgi:hypothetical protein